MNDRDPGLRDLRDVCRAADLLDVSEFELFAAAYQAWHREAPPPALVERHFADYMFSREVPVWVRQLTRQTLREAGLGAGPAEERVLPYLAGRLRETLRRTGRLVRWSLVLAGARAAPVPAPGERDRLAA